ncbi:MAG: STAS domain-containing protein [Sterolibacterium sp.]|nr:STAS domain-containing protein [Sterolibacterium sp.]
MMQRLGEGEEARVAVKGAMTLAEASALLATGASMLAEAETVFDLSAVESVDSSSLAVIFGWLRQAQAQEKTLCIAHPPRDLLSLAALYGVTELLPLCSTA